MCSAYCFSSAPRANQCCQCGFGSKEYEYVTDVRQLHCEALSTVECFATYKQGFCQYYAPTMAVILRDLKVPTRIVEGFLPGEREGGNEILRNNNAHAWVEVYFPGFDWVPFDPTGANNPVQMAAALPTGVPGPSSTPKSSQGSAGALPTIPVRNKNEGSDGPSGSIGPINRSSLGPLVAVGLLLLVAVVAAAAIAYRRGPRGATTADAAYGMPSFHRPRRRTIAIVVVATVGLAIVGGATAVETNALGAGRLFDRAVAKIDRLLAGPVPDRAGPETVLVTSPNGSDAPDELDPDEGGPAESLPPDIEPSAGPEATPIPLPTARPTPDLTAAPTPQRRPVDFDILKDHARYFAHEIKDTWCAPAGIQMALAILHHGDTSAAFQRELQSRVHEWESRKDALDGLWGPSAMTLALDAYGAKGYEVRAYRTRQGALRDAAKAVMKTRSPVLLMIRHRRRPTWRPRSPRPSRGPSPGPEAGEGQPAASRFSVSASFFRLDSRVRIVSLLPTWGAGFGSRRGRPAARAASRASARAS